MIPLALILILLDARNEAQGRVPSEIARIEVSDHYVNSYGLRDKVEVVIRGLAKIAFQGKDPKDLKIEVVE